jgi:pimeloyl-ACP methyl ester carboxylesterase
MIEAARAEFGGIGTRVLSVPGAGMPVVMLHGYGDSADTWRAVLTELEGEGRRALALDLPGFGHADPRSPGRLLPQFDDFADAVLATVGPAVLMGNSLGAATAVRAAARNESVKALVTLDDPLGVDNWLARLARRSEVSVGVWGRVGRAPIPKGAVRWATRKAMPRALYGPNARPDPEVVAHWVGSLQSFADVATLGRYAFQYAHETKGGHRDVRVNCPTLIVHGAKDKIIPVNSSRELHQQIPGSELVVLPRSGHCPQLDAPSEVVRLVLRVLDRVEP